MGVTAIWGLVALAWGARARRLRAAELSILVALTVLTAFDSLLVVYLMATAVTILLPHLAGICAVKGWLPSDSPSVKRFDESGSRTLQFGFSLAAALVIWVFFALSPLATPVLGVKPRFWPTLTAAKRLMTWRNYCEKSSRESSLGSGRLGRLAGLEWSSRPQDCRQLQRRRTAAPRAERHGTSDTCRHGLDPNPGPLWWLRGLLVIDRDHQPWLADSALVGTMGTTLLKTTRCWLL